jgi:hypothetical protein
MLLVGMPRPTQRPPRATASGTHEPSWLLSIYLYGLCLHKCVLISVASASISRFRGRLGFERESRRCARRRTLLVDHRSTSPEPATRRMSVSSPGRVRIGSRPGFRNTAGFLFRSMIRAYGRNGGLRVVLTAPPLEYLEHPPWAFHERATVSRLLVASRDRTGYRGSTLLDIRFRERRHL